MVRITAVAVLLAAARLAAAQSEPLDAYRPLLQPEWTGTLTYTDYGDDSTRVVLGVRIGVTEARDSTGAPALRLAYAYTEPDGRPVDGGADLLVPGEDPSRLRFGDAEWTVVRLDTTGRALRLVVEQESEDNDRPATVRETIAVQDDALTILKEVRYAGTDAFFERHTYALRPVPAARDE